MHDNTAICNIDQRIKDIQTFLEIVRNTKKSLLVSATPIDNLSVDISDIMKLILPVDSRLIKSD